MSDLNLQKLVPLDRDGVSSVLTAVSQSMEDPNILETISKEVLKLFGDAEVQAVEATPEGIFKVDDTDKFEAVANVYVVLHSPESSNSFTMSDTLPAYVFGHFSGGVAVIDGVSVDQPESDGSDEQ